MGIRLMKKANTGLLVFLLLIVVGVLIFVLAQDGKLDNAFKGTGLAVVDPCEREFDQCNRGCGEGFLSSVCKEKCSFNYRKCRSNP